MAADIIGRPLLLRIRIVWNLVDYPMTRYETQLASFMRGTLLINVMPTLFVDGTIQMKPSSSGPNFVNFGEPGMLFRTAHSAEWMRLSLVVRSGPLASHVLKGAYPITPD